MKREKQEMLTTDSNFLTDKSSEQRWNAKVKQSRPWFYPIPPLFLRNEFQWSFVRYVVPGFSEEPIRKTKKLLWRRPIVGARKKIPSIMKRIISHVNDMSSYAVNLLPWPFLRSRWPGEWRMENGEWRGGTWFRCWICTTSRLVNR